MNLNYRTTGVARGADAVLSIEIACLGLHEPVPIVARGFAAVGEAGLRTRCVPPRFAAELAELSGCLYRVGHSVGAQADLLSAYALLSPAARERFPPSTIELAAEHRAEVEQCVAALLAASPAGRLLFTTDWQYGPEWAHRFGPLSLAEFWSLHASGHLYLNTAYEIERGA